MTLPMVISQPSMTIKALPTHMPQVLPRAFRSMGFATVEPNANQSTGWENWQGTGAEAYHSYHDEVCPTCGFGSYFQDECSTDTSTDNESYDGSVAETLMPQKSIKTMPLLGESGDDSQVDIHEGTENGGKASPRDQKASQLSFRPVHLQVERWIPEGTQRQWSS